MSIGNTNDYGNKGNNFSYQLNVLKALCEIAANTGGPSGDSCCPATNDLLIEIRDNTADIEITADSINLNTDDLEACCEAGNVLLTDIAADTANLDVALSTLATEATLVALNAQFTPVVRTPSLARVTTAGTVAAGARAVSVYNAGLADGTWLGAVIKPGEQFNYSADGENDTLSAFAYDGTGTELVIITVV